MRCKLEVERSGAGPAAARTTAWSQRERVALERPPAPSACVGTQVRPRHDEAARSEAQQVAHAGGEGVAADVDHELVDVGHPLDSPAALHPRDLAPRADRDGGSRKDALHEVPRHRRVERVAPDEEPDEARVAGRVRGRVEAPGLLAAASASSAPLTPCGNPR